MSQFAQVDAMRALVTLSVKSPGRYVPITELHPLVPDRTISALESQYAGLHDHGVVTRLGYGKNTKVRWDALIWINGDGSFGYVIDTEFRIPVADIKHALDPGTEAVKCS